MAASSEDSTGAGSTSETASSPGGGHIPQFLVGCWQEASVSQVDLSIDLLECLHAMAAGFQEKKKKKPKKQRRGHSAFYNPASEVTLHHFTIFSSLELNH